MKSFAIGAVIALGLTSGASALTIDASDWGPAGCVGQQSCTIGGTMISASLYDVNGPGPNANQLSNTTISEQDFRGVKGLGVQFLGGSDNRPEIQGPRTGINGARDGIGESLTFKFARPLSIVEIVIAHFYNPTAFGSDPQEVAIIEGYNGATLLGTLTLQNLNYSGGLGTGFTASGASFTDIVRATDNSPANLNAGVFTISDLFKDEGQVDKLVFKAGAIVGNGDTSDYSVESVAAIPLPMGVWFALTGLAGVVALRRRKAQAA